MKVLNKTVAVVAAYNEASSIGYVINNLLPLVDVVVVVDDGSADRTSEIAKSCGATVLRHVINRGQGAAQQTGNEYALRIGADIIVHFDADGQHDSADVLKFIEPLKKDEVDMVLGSRFLGSANLPLSRKIILKLGLLFVWFYSGLRLTDSQNGFRAFSRSAAKKIVITQDGMAHASEILDEIAEQKLRYKEVPVTIHYTAETLAKGQSGFNSINIVTRLIWDKFLQ
jgi:glycosyltransferase involved in cell wall biosynthesis